MTTPDEPTGKPDVFAALALSATLFTTTGLCALVLVLSWQVFARYVLNASPGWTEPVALTLLNFTALCGAALGVRAETHFAFPTLISALPGAAKRALRTSARAIACAFGLALAFYGTILMLDSWSVPMAGAPLPEGVGFIGLVLGGALIAIFAFERLIMGDPPQGAD